MRNLKEKVFVSMEFTIIILEILSLIFCKSAVHISFYISLFYLLLNFSGNLKYNRVIINKEIILSLIFSTLFLVLFLFSIISTIIDTTIIDTEMSIKLSFIISSVWIFKAILKSVTKEKIFLQNTKTAGLQIVILSISEIFSHIILLSYLGLILCQIIGIIQIHLGIESKKQ